MTAGLAENIGGRSQPRYTGEPVTHDVRFSRFSGAPFDAAGYRPPAEVARCICGWSALIDGGHSDAEKQRLARHHAGIPDP